MSFSPRSVRSPNRGLSIRLFCPDSQPPAGESPEQTLPQFFDAVFVPLAITPRRLTEKTVGLLRDSLAHWSRLTGDPPLSRIDDFVAATFVERLLALPGRKKETLSLYTVKRHVAAIQQILDFAGPKKLDRRGRKNRGLIAEPPLLDRPALDRDPPAGDFSLPEIQAILRATASLPSTPRYRSQAPIYPDGVTQPRWWQAFVVVACYTGLRVGDLMRLRYEDLSGCEITVRSETAKGRKGKRQYLAAPALAEIEAIRTARERIFEWRNWETNPRWQLTIWKRLLAAAGLPPSRRFGFHGLRKFHATQIAEASGAGLGIAAAQLSLGHSSAATTRGHYVAGITQRKLAAAAIDALPQVKAPAASGDRQRLLFE